jgi:hypothetical protein
MALKGHGFSRANGANSTSPALAAGRIEAAAIKIPQGLKPNTFS